MSNSDEFRTWLLNSSSKNTYEVLYLDEDINISMASRSKKINYVIYVSDKTIILSGNGSYNKPYLVK